MASSTNLKPVRLVLFDVFDTLCTPRIPVHEQYHEEAIRGGLSPASITPQSVRNAFKPAFKKVDAQYPLYGKHSTPSLTPKEWWTMIIYETLREAGASKQELDGKIDAIGPALMSRFESDEGYRNFPETIACLKELKELEVKTSVVSNADPRILKTLDSLQILPLLTCSPTLSWDVEAAKPSVTIYEKACERCEEKVGEGIIMVGDELKADFYGATSTGIEARLIRRPGEWSDGAVRDAKEELSGVNIVSSLQDIVNEVKQRNISKSI
ncbi:hypothetical protein I315_04707 [Cryptococcus gattii Ru294]|uniref:Uncharacterized protein n=2 Tax=Cryptococcus gattii TaxID=37769 RepID=E6RFD5_CRYGW|nr:Hypothetical protein CGB_M2370C [Cryptococcus gattii WM276]KIR52844.1 hypothetical protein I315_04707 [Cryptococcus gattii Ru294]KIR78797.1 hypothetical protein I306_04159 [Cryptococcus gattii EJB2]KIY32863.1 hypothetical protein I305_04616 [Cryptococcus gattii E566]KJE05073.1 hypothetical protein I311_01166 [Cryptococcus gattii NT-10]ADV25538.1 Hypothetical protein CGB_M2370C [Cryptococcus gattii WM276]